MSVRKAHNSGKNHLRNVVEYYQQIGHDRAQSVIDSITSSYAAEGQQGPNPMMGGPPGPGNATFPPPFGFPGGMMPPFPMNGPPPSGFPQALGRGMPFPPFPPPNAQGGPPPGGMLFPPPNGMPFPPPNFPPQGMGPSPVGPSPGGQSGFGPPPGFGGGPEERR